MRYGRLEPSHQGAPASGKTNPTQAPTPPGGRRVATGGTAHARVGLPPRNETLAIATLGRVRDYRWQRIECLISGGQSTGGLRETSVLPTLSEITTHKPVGDACANGLTQTPAPSRWRIRSLRDKQRPNRSLPSYASCCSSFYRGSSAPVVKVAPNKMFPLGQSAQWPPPLRSLLHQVRNGMRVIEDPFSMPPCAYPRGRSTP